MDKLSVFSNKLNKVIEVQGISCDECNADTDLAYSSWSDESWNNSSYDSWMDNGWNNSSYDSWRDKGWNNSSYSTWYDKGWNNSGGGPCYITTACVHHKGLSDNCDELQTLRRQRDILCQKDADFRQLVLQYYRQAPRIIEKLNSCPDRDERLEYIYSELVVKCVYLFEENKTQEAIKVFKDVYSDLEREFLQ